MSNPEAEARIIKIIKMLKTLNPTEVYTRESTFKGTPIWKICWPNGGGGYKRISEYLELEIEKLNQQKLFND